MRSLNDTSPPFCRTHCAFTLLYSFYYTSLMDKRIYYYRETVSYGDSRIIRNIIYHDDDAYEEWYCIYLFTYCSLHLLMAHRDEAVVMDCPSTLLVMVGRCRNSWLVFLLSLFSLWSNSVSC
jgi:hypothetical protein